MLLIYDNVGDGAAELANYAVAAPDRVPGAWLEYFGGVDSLAALEGVKTDHAEVEPAFQVVAADVNSALKPPYAVRVTAKASIDAGGVLELVGAETMATSLLVNGEPYLGSNVVGNVTMVLHVLVESHKQL